MLALEHMHGCGVYHRDLKPGAAALGVRELVRVRVRVRVWVRVWVRVRVRFRARARVRVRVRDHCAAPQKQSTRPPG